MKSKNNTGKTVLFTGVALLGGYLLYRYTTKKMISWNSVFPVDLPPGLPTGSGGSGGVGAGYLPIQTIKPSKVSSNANLQDPVQLKAVFDNLTKIFGSEISKNVERIFRHETGNFTSGGYLMTGAAGAIPTSQNYPYGFQWAKEGWDKYPGLRPIGIVKMGNGYNYLAFPGAAGFAMVAERMRQVGNNPGRWNSNDPGQIAVYNGYINNLTPKYA